MLVTLRIQNIVLIEEAKVCFQAGFNVLTGETGAGKSAIMRALALVLGQRADSQTLRAGADTGCIEAAFDIKYTPALCHALDEAGIAYEEDELLLLRRDLTVPGKNRAYINNQMAQTATLRQVGQHLVEIVGQHANQLVRDASYHRELVDRYGELHEALANFHHALKQEKQLDHQLAELSSTEAERLREVETLRKQLEEIETVQPQEDEEEELFTEYTRLSNADELSSITYTLLSRLSESEESILSQVYTSQRELDRLHTLDPSLTTTRQDFLNASAELSEVSHTLRNYLNSIDSNPSRARELSDRLQTLTRLKKKYGPDLADVIAYAKSGRNRLDTLTNADVCIENLEKKLFHARKATHDAATALSKQRQQAAQLLAKQLTVELRQLNMPKVEVEVRITPQPRSQDGDDYIELFFTPNVGEKLVSICSCASGGELSRLTLAIRTLLAHKQLTPTLVFDEVDANIGGTTATIVGTKLRALGESRQVLCITHFPQAAQNAHHHLLVEKQEHEARTYTTISELKPQQRMLELQRMSGGALEPIS